VAVIKHYKCLHERVVILHAEIQDSPYIPAAQRAQVTQINEQFYIVEINFGFMDELDLPAAMACCKPLGLTFNPMDTSFFLGRETLVPRLGKNMVFWREKFFIMMYRNAGSITTYFKIPPNRVVELGTQVAL
jgi:KUP system potassium uptake protein